jgi:hypothetical protein
VKCWRTRPDRVVPSHGRCSCEPHAKNPLSQARRVARLHQHTADASSTTPAFRHCGCDHGTQPQTSPVRRSATSVYDDCTSRSAKGKIWRGPAEPREDERPHRLTLRMRLPVLRGCRRRTARSRRTGWRPRPVPLPQPARQTPSRDSDDPRRRSRDSRASNIPSSRGVRRRRGVKRPVQIALWITSTLCGDTRPEHLLACP